MAPGPASLLRRIAALLAVLAVGTLLVACGTAAAPPTSGPSGRLTPATGADLTVAHGVAPSVATTGLPTVTLTELPPEALVTLALIQQRGPYPYSKDGVTFQNREGILPKQKPGFYQEYTVDTPGSSDRGARRIITGKDGSRFYTDDHYDSFREVVSRAGS